MDFCKLVVASVSLMAKIDLLTANLKENFSIATSLRRFPWRPNAVHAEDSFASHLHGAGTRNHGRSLQNHRRPGQPLAISGMAVA